MGGPYASTTAALGELPTPIPDIPITAVFLALYIGGAVCNMFIYQTNLRKGHKFMMSGAMFGFCMARITTTTLRIAWATRPHNVSLAITAQILVNAGVLVVYIVLLLLAQRVLRALHPEIGWNKALSRLLLAMYVGVGVALVLVITFTVISAYTLNHSLKTAALWVQRGSSIYLLTFNVLSGGIWIACLVLPPSRNAENFGAGSMKKKMFVLGVALFFIVFLSGFRAGTALMTAPPASDPAWYDTKPAFYVIIFGFELITLYWLVVMRFDRLFWVPNGSSGPGDYSRGVESAVKEKPVDEEDGMS